MLKKALAVVGVLVFLGIAVIGAALVTGTIAVDDPAAAAGEILTGDVQEPEVEVESIDVGPVGVPQGSISDIDEEGATVETEISVNNTANHVGGTVDLIEYDAYMSSNPDTGFEYVGSGSIEELVVPPNGTVTETNSFDAEYDDLATALGSNALGVVLGDGMYMRVEGEATLDFGVTSFTVEFETTEELS